MTLATALMLGVVVAFVRLAIFIWLPVLDQPVSQVFRRK